MTPAIGAARAHSERGSASVLVVGCCVAVLLVGVLAAAVADVGRAAAQSRVAADLSALAGASVLLQGLRGESIADPCEQAAVVARRNAATVISCAVDDQVNVTVQVTVALTGAARRIPGVRPPAAMARAGPAPEPRGQT